jgi:hypothetical protein
MVNSDEHDLKQAYQAKSPTFCCNCDLCSSVMASKERQMRCDVTTRECQSAVKAKDNFLNKKENTD